MTDTRLQLAREVAAELGDGWTAVQDPDHGLGRGISLVHRDGRAISVGSDWRATGKLILRGVYPYEVSQHCHSVEHFEIGASASKGARLIARDIRSRLMGDYEAELARLRGVAEDKLRRERTQEAMTGRLALSAGVTVDDRRRGGDSFGVQGSSGGESGWSGHVDVGGYRGEPTVTVELRSLPEEYAAGILRQLAAAEARRLAPDSPGPLGEFVIRGGALVHRPCSVAVCPVDEDDELALLCKVAEDHSCNAE